MTALHEHLREQLGALPVAARTQGWRRSALEEFAARGLPTRRDERWRYTDLSALAEQRFRVPDAPANGDTRAAVAALIAARGIAVAGPRIVIVDGRVDAELSALATEGGVEIASPPAEAEPVAASEPRAAAGAHITTPRHVLAAINAALNADGLRIRIARDIACGAPILIVFVAASAEPTASQARIRIELESGASATIVQQFLDLPEAGAGWLNVVTEVAQAQGTQLEIYRLQEHAPTRFHTALMAATLGADARLKAACVESGARIARNDTDVALTGPGAHVELLGLTLAAGTRHVDHQVHVDHASARTTSTQIFRAIVDDAARGVFGGKVTVRPGAQKIDARQSSDNLLLSPRAEIDTKPELEIYADDVKCQHGATVGEIDRDHMFYLRSRGIDEADARALLTLAFAEAALERIALPALCERVRAALLARAPARPAETGR